MKRNFFDISNLVFWILLILIGVFILPYLKEYFPLDNNLADVYALPANDSFVAVIFKTPPCTNLILQHKIPKVVIGCADSFAKVNGRGIQQLKDNRVQVVYGMLENDCKALNKQFFTFNNKKRPYITLKWAQSKNGKIAGKSNERIFISNDITNRLVHK